MQEGGRQDDRHPQPQPTPQPVQPQPAPNNQQPSVHAPTGVVINPNLGGGGGGGAVQAVRKAVKRAANENDLQQLHTFIDTASLNTGQMPNREQIADALKKEAPNLYKLWEEQVIEVTGTRTRSMYGPTRASRRRPAATTCSSVPAASSVWPGSADGSTEARGRGRACPSRARSKRNSKNAYFVRGSDGHLPE